MAKSAHVRVCWVLIPGCVAVACTSRGAQPDDSEPDDTGSGVASFSVAGDFVQLAVGGTFADQVCALDVSGATTCWTYLEDGQECLRPKFSSGSLDQLTMHPVPLCALIDGTVECMQTSGVSHFGSSLQAFDSWLDGDELQICGSSKDGVDCAVPDAFWCGSRPPAGIGFVDLHVDGSRDSGGQFACGIDSSGTGWCWGAYPGSGCEPSLLGECNCSVTDPPLEFGGPFTQMAGLWACALTPEGRLECPLLGAFPSPDDSFSSVAGHDLIVGVTLDAQIVVIEMWGGIKHLLDPPPGFQWKRADIRSVWDGKALHDLVCGIDSDGGLHCWGDDRVADMHECE